MACSLTNWPPAPTTDGAPPTDGGRVERDAEGTRDALVKAVRSVLDDA